MFGNDGCVKIDYCMLGACLVDSSSTRTMVSFVTPAVLDCAVLATAACVLQATRPATAG